MGGAFSFGELLLLSLAQLGFVYMTAPDYAARKTVNARLYPTGGLAVLSRREVAKLRDASSGGMRDMLRYCALAVLTSGQHSDDPRAAREQYPDFDIDIAQHDRGLCLELKNAPCEAFVEGDIITGMEELLFSVVRDLAYTAIEMKETDQSEKDPGNALSEVVFGLLRNARLLKPQMPNLVVCWGGHSINDEEYAYTKQVGYALGLRGLDICTGCGPGAMKGPMKGAAIAHAKQRQQHPRYIGLTEPGIIAAESPNPIVNELVIFPDIEKRLEGFVRMGHGFIVFPGGVGTAEEILYILGILLCEENQHAPFPLVFTGPASSKAYFEQIDKFIQLTLGDDACSRYRIIIDDPEEVGRHMARGIEQVKRHRVQVRDSFFFNWSLRIPLPYQQTFLPTHENVAALDLRRGRERSLLAADLRRAFSAIVAGNVKEEGVRAVEQFGPYQIRGDADLMVSLDALLRAFVEQRRMKIEGEYRPCYQLLPVA